MLTLARITTLAAADAINPCALAVLTMVLIAILLHDPNKRKNVLYAGLAFSAAVFIGYFFYGLIIVQLFKSLASVLSGASYYITKALALFAIVLGVLNIKDYFRYKPGSFATEMPMKIRPRVKLLIKQITSPKGAFVIGILVTLFLLPCTIGPYIIASGSLSVLKFFATIPWLLYYNAIFVIPMIAITLVVYLGLTEVEKVSGWKEKNIQIIHLVAGILLIGVGIALLFGWI